MATALLLAPAPAAPPSLHGLTLTAPSTVSSSSAVLSLPTTTKESENKRAESAQTSGQSPQNILSIAPAPLARVVLLASKRNDAFYVNPFLTTLRLQEPQNAMTNRVVVLDLDETLVHSCFDPVSLAQARSLRIWEDPTQFSYRPYFRTASLIDVHQFALPGQGVASEVIYMLRPHLLRFLVFLSYYTRMIIIWSAGHPKYVSAVHRELFRDLPSSHATLTKDDCSSDKYGDVAKPLQFVYDKFPGIAGPENTIIIDDRPSNIAANPQNGILIPPYEPAPTIDAVTNDDNALPALIDWFSSAAVMEATDVRTLDKSRIFTR